MNDECRMPNGNGTVLELRLSSFVIRHFADNLSGVRRT